MGTIVISILLVGIIAGLLCSQIIADLDKNIKLYILILEDSTTYHKNKYLFFVSENDAKRKLNELIEQNKTDEYRAKQSAIILNLKTLKVVE